MASELGKQKRKKGEIFILLCCTIFLTNVLNVGCQQEIESHKEDNRALSNGQNPLFEFANTVTVDELEKHVYFLASDEMEGRQSGSEGAEAAALYAADFFKKQNLDGFFPGAELFFQKFDMEKRELKECFLKNEHAQVNNWKAFLEISNDFYGEIEKDLYFLGYGREGDFDGLDIKGKLVAFWSGDPESDKSTGEIDREKSLLAFEEGAAGCLLIPEDEDKFLNYIRQIKPYFPPIRYYLFKKPDEALIAQRNISISSSALARLFGISSREFEAYRRTESNRSRSPLLSTKITMKTTYKSHGIIPTKNVLAKIEGTDNKEEYIILSAHYDGRGIVEGQICNGANDNATGVAAVLEMAQAFALAAENGFRTRRSLMFLLPAAEELLGLGSTYYVDNPVVPLAKTVAAVNMDPLGREDAERPNLKNHIYIYTSSKGKKDLNEILAYAKKDFFSNLRIETKDSYTGSDHVFFERKGLPVIAFTTGTSSDNHKPGDDAHKIQYQKLEDISRLIFATVWELANREEDIKKPSP